jgi:oligoendopeptidase F
MADSWDLSRICPSEEDFISRLKKLEETVVNEGGKLQGHLKEDKAFSKLLDLERLLEKEGSALGMFASMRSDLDKRNVKNSEDLSLLSNSFDKMTAVLSYADPEVLSLGEKRVKDFLKTHQEYQEFSYSFVRLFKEKDHVLTKDMEALLSCYAPLSGEGGDLYSTLTVADRIDKEVTLHDGKKVKVTMGNWTRLIEEAKDSKEDREKIFLTLYSYYDEHKNTYGEIYSQVLKTELAQMKARKYSSILESHLSGNNIPTSVFMNLVKTAEEGSAPLKKYYEIKRKYLGLEKFRSYDRFIPLAESNKKFTYEEAKDTFFKSIEKLPLDFQNKAHEVLKDGYVDVYEKEGKRSGAYSEGGDNVHPYILFNFDGGLDSVFTVAHESGHSIHTLYSEENQPLMTQQYTIFVAEIASTFNEHNLMDYFLTSDELSRADKIVLLQKEIDEICSTFYRQTLFAEFEYHMALKAEKGEPISYENCSEEMIALYKSYYGIDIEEEKLKKLVWAYIPHLFYTPFYVYQYATSFAASYQFYKNVKEKKEHAFENYISLLKAGGSDFPIDEVKKAGVDLTTTAPFEAVVEAMTRLVDELEKTLEEK